MLVARAKLYLARLANHGILRHHMLIRIPVQTSELLVTTFAEIQEVSKIPYGATQLILILHGRSVILLVHLCLRMLMTLQSNLRRDDQQEGGRRIRVNGREELMPRLSKLAHKE